MLHLKKYCKFCGHALNETNECENKDCLNYAPDTGNETVATPTTATADGTSTTT